MSDDRTVRVWDLGDGVDTKGHQVIIATDS